MTTFKEISGQLIKTLSSDPANPQIGEIWYNNTIGVLKGYVNLGGAWASGGNMTTARQGLAGAGTQTEGLAFGGIAAPFPTLSNSTEEYNGSTWAGGGNMGTARTDLGGAGTQTAGLAFGGQIPTFASTEEYNGSTWGPGGNLSTGRYSLAGAGTQTAALGFAGYPVPGVGTRTEAYDGTAWTSVSPMSTARNSLAGAGTQTVGLAFGGTPPLSTATEEFTDPLIITQTLTTS